MRVRAAQHGGVQHAGGDPVGDVAAAGRAGTSGPRRGGWTGRPSAAWRTGRGRGARRRPGRRWSRGDLLRGAHPRGGADHGLGDELVAGAAAQVARDGRAHLGRASGRGSPRGSRRPASASRGCSSRTAGPAWPRTRPGAGGSSPSRASPSTVLMSAPSACTANVMQDRMLAPSSRTVQVPQTPCSQPMWVPGEPEILAEEVDEQPPRLHLGHVRAAVDGQADGAGAGGGQRVSPLVPGARYGQFDPAPQVGAGQGEPGLRAGVQVADGRQVLRRPRWRPRRRPPSRRRRRRRPGPVRPRRRGSRSGRHR